MVKQQSLTAVIRVSLTQPINVSITYLILGNRHHTEPHYIQGNENEISKNIQQPDVFH